MKKRRRERAANRESYRDEFSDFEGVVFLNCATQGPFPRQTAAAIEQAIALKTRPDRISDALYFQLPNETRQELAALLGGRPQDYALTNGASDGAFAVARGLAWQPGDQVLMAEGDFPCNFFPWANLDQRGLAKGVRLRVLPSRGEPIRCTQFLRALGPRTRVVATSLVSYTTGLRLDIERLGEACRNNGTLLVVDVTQAAGALPLRLDRLPIDVAICAGYKWLLSPYGTGFAYFRPEVLRRLRVTDLYWQAVEGAENFNRLSRKGWKLAAGARRFDSTETASFLNVSAMLASLRFLRRVGVEAVEEHARRLLDCLARQLPPGYRVVSSLKPAERSTVLAVVAANPDATRRTYESLRAADVVVSLRQDRIRVSPHLYNTEADIARCLQVLRSIS